jgi:hypothetical protein
MSTKHADIFSALAAPFDRQDLKERPGGRGKNLTYITARTAMNRLDEVLGPEGWSDRFYEVCNVLFCEITITLPDGTKVSKSDGGGFKEMTEGGKVDQENTDKTGPSDAFKRAAAKFGIARYLYKDGTADLGQTTSGQHRQSAPASNGQRSGNAKGGTNSQGGGRALYAWAKDEGEKTGKDLVKWLNALGKKRSYPERLVDWSKVQADEAYAKLVDKLAADANPGDAYEEALTN